MPQPVLPESARNMSGIAVQKLRDDLMQNLPFETFSILYYEGEVGGEYVSGLFDEVDQDTWTERVGGDLFTYQEVSETADEVVLYDASRDRQVTIDWRTFDLIVVDDGTEQLFSVIDQAHSLWA